MSSGQHSLEKLTLQIEKLTKNYLKLRGRAHELVLEKPQRQFHNPDEQLQQKRSTRNRTTKTDSNFGKDWTGYLDKVFAEEEKNLEEILFRENENNNCDITALVAEEIAGMKRKLEMPGTEIVAEVTESEDSNPVQRHVIQSFWTEEVAKFIDLLLDWIQEGILTVVTEFEDEGRRRFALGDFMDQGKDLLWGIYAWIWIIRIFGVSQYI